MFFQKIAYANRKILCKVNDILNLYGLNTSDWRVFLYLSMHQSSNITLICEFYEIDRAILSRNVAKLEKLGFLEFLSPDDKREKFITLSTKGKEVFFDANIKIRRYESEVFSVLTKEEKDLFLKLVDSINHNL